MHDYKTFRPVVKAAADDGTVSFVVATLGVADSDGDVTLPGFFGKQDIAMVPSHDWSHVPIGKGVLYEAGNEAIVDAKFNLDIPAAKDWHSAIKFDLANPPALQEYSYGFQVLPGGSRWGDHDGQEVRFLCASPDGGPGVKVFEASPVLRGAGIGTRTLSAKGASNTFTHHAVTVLSAVTELTDRAADVMAMRTEKGKTLGTESTALLARLEAELKRLNGLLAIPLPASDPTEMQREYLRYLETTA